LKKHQLAIIKDHPYSDAVALIEVEPEASELLRADPDCPAMWWTDRLGAWRVSVAGMGDLATVFGRLDFTVIDEREIRMREVDATRAAESATRDAANAVAAGGKLPRDQWPPWCGECDEHTRQREALDGYGGNPAVMRCPRCHPLRGQPLRSGDAHHVEPPPDSPDVEAVKAHVARMRDTLDRSQVTMRDRRRQDETLDVPRAFDPFAEGA